MGRMSTYYKPTFLRVVGITLLALGTVLSPSWSQESSESVASATPNLFLGSMKVSGSLTSSYYFNSFDGRDDHDIYEYLNLQAKDIVKDYVDAAVSMSWHEDLDGLTTSPKWDDPFYDLSNASDNRVRFYTGYVDIKHLGFEDSRLRLGRQYLEEIDFAHFDGAAYQFSPYRDWNITLFGGRPITYYSSTRGDAIYGGNVEYDVNPQLKTALRYYIYDANQFNDDLGAFEFWYRYNPNLMSHHEFALLDGEPYTLKNDLFARVDSIDLDINAQVLRLFETVGDHTINFNPYFALEYGLEPFTYGSIFLTKGMGEYWSLVGGFDIREADGQSNPYIRSTNRDYRRFTGGVEIYPTQQLTLGINGEYWDVDPQKDEFFGVTGEIEYKLNKQWTLSSGVDYGEYVQEFRDEYLWGSGLRDIFRITPDVITYYGRVRWRPTDKIYAAARFEVEDSDFDTDNWYAVRLELGVNF